MPHMGHTTWPWPYQATIIWATPSVGPINQSPIPPGRLYPEHPHHGQYHMAVPHDHPQPLPLGVNHTPKLCPWPHPPCRPYHTDIPTPALLTLWAAPQSHIPGPPHGLYHRSIPQTSPTPCGLYQVANPRPHPSIWAIPPESQARPRKWSIPHSHSQSPAPPPLQWAVPHGHAPGQLLRAAASPSSSAGCTCAWAHGRNRLSARRRPAPVGTRTPRPRAPGGSRKGDKGEGQGTAGPTYHLQAPPMIPIPPSFPAHLRPCLQVCNSPTPLYPIY